MSSSKKDVFNLVKSLTPSEKGYYVKYAKRHQLNDQSDYLWLFYQLDKQEVLNWDRIEERMPLGRFKSGTSKIIKRLYEEILKSMRFYHEQSKGSVRIQGMLVEAEFLQDKGLLEQFSKRITALQTLIETYDYPSFSPIIQKHKWSLVSHGLLKGKAIEQLKQKEIDDLEKRKLAINIRIHIHQFSKYQRSYLLTGKQEVLDKLAEINTILDKITKTEEIDFFTQQTVLNCRSIYFFLVKDHSRGLSLLNQAINQYKTQPHFILEGIPNFIVLYYHALLWNLISGDWATFKDLLILPQQAHIKKSWIAQIDRIKRPLLIGYYLHRQDMLSAKKEVDHSMRELPGSYVGKWEEAEYYQYMMNGYYFYSTGQFRKCIQTMELLVDCKNTQYKPLQGLGYFMLGLCYYSMHQKRYCNRSIYRATYFIRHKLKDNTYGNSIKELIELLGSSDNIDALKLHLFIFMQQRKEEKDSFFMLFDLELLFPRSSQRKIQEEEGKSSTLLKTLVS